MSVRSFDTIAAQQCELTAHHSFSGVIHSRTCKYHAFSDRYGQKPGENCPFCLWVLDGIYKVWELINVQEKITEILVKARHHCDYPNCTNQGKLMNGNAFSGQRMYVCSEHMSDYLYVGPSLQPKTIPMWRGK